MTTPYRQWAEAVEILDEERELERREAEGERQAEQAAERYYESGGEAAMAIAAEDDYERELEAMDEGLQELRARREGG